MIARVKPEPDQLHHLFQALGDPTRLQVVEILGSGPRRAGELSAQVGISAPVMSKHLRVLLAAGVVEDERLAVDARARVFRLRPDSVVALGAWLDQLRAHWDDQLGSFRRHVEAKKR
jgi:DNA-binding transcriptional ArsR family regulator